MRSFVAAFFLILLHAVALASATAQTISPGGKPLPMDEAFRLSAQRNEDGRVRLQWTIAPGYYLYQDGFGLRSDASDLPLPSLEGEAVSKNDPTFGVTTIYHDRVAATVPVSRGVKELTVSFQGCQDGGICYPPASRSVDPLTLAVSGGGGGRSGAPAMSEWVQAPAIPGPEMSQPESGGITLSRNDQGMVAGLLADGGVLFVLGSFLLFGLALAFTPCVLPMYPILGGALARQGDRLTPLRGLALSLAFVLAMSSAFALLGVVAAWSGQNLQMVLQSPLAVGAVAALFAVLALPMFGLFELQLPASWVSAVGRVGQGRRGSLASAGLLGFTSALIVGPCVTAPLAGALLHIAQTGDVRLGAASLFALGLGKGIPLIAFGTFGPAALPKTGAWMNGVRQAFGFVFLGAAIWMLSRLVPASVTMALWALLAIGTATFLGAFDTLSPDAPGSRRVGKAAGLAAALYGILLGVGAASGSGDPFRPLDRMLVAGAMIGERPAGLDFQLVEEPQDLDRQVARAGGRTTLLYVTADWCVTCAAIERSVLSDPATQQLLSGLHLVKVDVSENTMSHQELMRRLEAFGPPTMVFLDPQGREVSNTRLVGDVTRSGLADAVSRAEAGS
ncbi:cytochrome c biogenesis protein transmembrane region [Nitratireductor indicus C115]|uniref:Cytochrome c biogenesis protein transmembrane region n=1 Tax=Nitratireductor indicus C115 TaxID=1231190 RepID=K2P5G6_9HYPH|nr:protein-disulfide reductase DsbD [Nitratireductor indicus]EKF42561.1 cytochrome c biogenesis protein transmembrane region [Nitratireductor indicus C115]SFQ57361.1 thiol:disulfide interchange protein DsbD [Nitratireductor indicus]